MSISLEGAERSGSLQRGGVALQREAGVPSHIGVEVSPHEIFKVPPPRTSARPPDDNSQSSASEAGDSSNNSSTRPMTAAARIEHVRQSLGGRPSLSAMEAATAAAGGFLATHTLRGHNGFVFSLACAKGQLFSASQDATVRVWSLQPDQTGSVAELTGHHGFVRALAVSGGGALLFSGSQDKMVRVWDTHTHVQLCALPGHKAEVHSLAVHNDLLFSGSEDANIKVEDHPSSPSPLPS